MIKTGTDKKGDLVVELELTDLGTINLVINSKVQLKYGESIRASVLTTLNELGVDSADVKINDYGAWDFAIRARVETAARRALGGNT